MDTLPRELVESCRGMNGISPSADLIAAHCDYLREKGRLPRTINHHEWLLSKLDRELPYGLDQAADDELRSVVYRDDLKPNSKIIYHSILSSFYAHCVRVGELPYNPMDDLPKPKARPGRPRPVSNQQLWRILTDGADPYRLWARIAAYLGARCIEISRLDRDDVAEDVTWLHGKGDKLRPVPTDPDVYAAISTLPPGPVARTKTGQRAKAQYVSIKAGQHFRQIGLTGVTMHRLRHWYGTNVRRNADLRAAQEALGHADPKTTALYTEVDMTELRTAVLALPRLTG